MSIAGRQVVRTPRADGLGQLLAKALQHAPASLDQIEYDVRTSIAVFRELCWNPSSQRIHRLEVKRCQRERRSVLGRLQALRAALLKTGLHSDDGVLLRSLEDFQLLLVHSPVVPFPPMPSAHDARLQLIWDLAVVLQTHVAVTGSRSGTLHQILEAVDPPRIRRRQRDPRRGGLKALDPATPPDFIKSMSPVLRVLSSVNGELRGRLRPSWASGPTIYSSSLRQPPLIVSFEHATPPSAPASEWWRERSTFVRQVLHFRL